jgi:hypothetical protein
MKFNQAAILGSNLSCLDKEDVGPQQALLYMF